MRFQKLDLNLIVLLEALLNTESVSRAGVQLNLTQPSVSNALARLRKHFDDELFVLVGRKMIPTALARSLREPVAQFLQLSRTIAQARKVFDPETAEREFSIVASDFVAGILLTKLCRKLLRVAPSISIQHVPITDRSIEKFQRGEHDVLIAPETVERNTVNRLFLFEEQLVPIAWASNDEVGPTITMEEFLNSPQVFARFGSVTQPSAVEEFLVAHGYHQTRRIQCESFLLLPEFVVGTPYLAAIHSRYAQEKELQLQIKILEPSFQLPIIREHIFWLPHLDGEPAAVWLRSVIESTGKSIR